MSVPPFRATKTMRRLLRVLVEQDDGRLYGLRIADLINENKHARWYNKASSGSLAPLLMRLENEGWVTSRWWGKTDTEAAKAFPANRIARRRFYSLHPDYIDEARHLIRSRHELR